MKRAKFHFERIKRMGLSDRQVLEIAISDAMERGYELPEYFDNIGDLLDFHHEFQVIFSHDFAKCFFPKTELEWPVCKKYAPQRFGWAVEKIPSWKFALQQMVVSSDPVDYLRRFIIGPF